jgi:hypothetical protein
VRAYFADLWARIEVRWHAIAILLLAAAPGILDWLGVIDLKPILMHFVSESVADLIVGCLPFVLAFVRPMLAVTPATPAPEEDE